MVEIVTKFPLVKLRKRITKERIMAKHGDKLCMIYSETIGKYKQGDEWIDDPNAADINTLCECYEATKDLQKYGIVYCTVKI